MLPVRPGYVCLSIPPEQLKPAVAAHLEFTAYAGSMAALFEDWRVHAAEMLRALGQGCHPKAVIRDLSESLLRHYTGRQLVDRYDVYQHLMDYWAATMSDDCYLIAADGWKAEPVMNARGKGWSCDLLPKPLLIARYFAAEQAAVEAKEAEAEALAARIADLEEEHGGDEGILGSLGKPYKKTARARLDEMIDDVVEKMERTEKTRRRRGTPVVRNFLDQLDLDESEEGTVLTQYLDLLLAETSARKAWRQIDAALDAACFAKYAELSENEIKTLVVRGKWLATVETAVLGELDRVREALTRRVRQLHQRYRRPLPELTAEVEALEARVHAHLERIGFAWQRDLKRAAMQELLKPKPSWITLRLSEVAPLQRGIDLPSTQIRPGPFPIVYSNGVLGLHNKAFANGPGVVTGRSGTLGSVHFVETDYWPHNTTLWVTDFKNNDPKFIYYLFVALHLQSFGSGSGVPTLNWNDVHDILVSIPDTTQEQRAIASILTDMDAEIATLEARLAKYRDLQRG